MSLLAGSVIPVGTNLTSNGTVNVFSNLTIANLNGSASDAVLAMKAATLLTVTGTGNYAGIVTDNNNGGTFASNANLSIGNALVGTLNVNKTLQIHSTSKTNALNLLGSSGAWTSGLDLSGTAAFILETTALTKATAFSQLRKSNRIWSGARGGDFLKRFHSGQLRHRAARQRRARHAKDHLWRRAGGFKFPVGFSRTARRCERRRTRRFE